MDASLTLTALVMGVVGGPHCVAMCGAACAGIGQFSAARPARTILLFQLGRVVGYSGLGALSAASLQGLGWLTVHSAALRPVWTLFHIAALVLGLLLLVQGQQPGWVDALGRNAWGKVRSLTNRHAIRLPVLVGVAWALLPCGLLYSALMVSAMANSVSGGAGVMAMFALGTSITMTIGPWLWLRLQSGNTVPLLGKVQVNGLIGVKVAGLALALSAAWALWMGLVHNTAPWCVTPA
ncbi:sulfite exporter TauE/SafE family protein [Rhodoferax aquaticus]|uniref:Sulfite exporter TauE/SafE family protein n=1 Tax=Rhodoferax aquaticus TaxID=2527691 RepID=A0A515EQ69_9BURK|nr:sulfite exporter TauE/SafE family protein [Rhodoferax aquaticus]QDL54818.1 sulfite exporter TauE/SafE family protein [Rhodoferax aquaticus]